MYEIGTVCVKIAGRDAGKKCVIVEAAKDGFVMIEGETRRRKCNVRHLEMLKEEVKVKSGASHAEVMKALGLEAKEAKSRKPATKPNAHANRAKKADKPAKKAKAPKAAKTEKAAKPAKAAKVEEEQVDE